MTLAGGAKHARTAAHAVRPAGGCGRPRGRYYLQVDRPDGPVSDALTGECHPTGRIVSEIRIRSFRAGQVSQWLSCGWRLWRRRPLEALLPAAVFALAALGLRAVPVIGDIVLLLLLPTVYSSYALHVHLLALTGNAPPVRRGAWSIERWGQELRRALFGAWGKQENIFPLILVGLALVVLGLLIHVLFNQIGGRAVVSPYGFLELGTDQMVRLLLAHAVAALLWILVLALLLWTLSLFALRDMVLLDAFVWNLRAFFGNAAAVLGLLLALAAGLVPAMVLKLWSPTGQVVALWLALTLVTTMFGLCAYCSYRLVFAEAEPPRPAPPSPHGARPRPAPPPGPRRL